MQDHRIHVAVAVIENKLGEILISLRPEHAHQGGLWEFPGGKVKAGESVADALRREIAEEVGVQANGISPLINITYDYADKAVLLDVWHVDSYQGEAHGLEGQQIAWVKREELHRFTFPAANRPILNALQLPYRYLITPDPGTNLSAFMQQLEASLQKGISLVQLRAKQLDRAAYEALALQCRLLCDSYSAKLILNTHYDLVAAVGAAGTHITSSQLHYMQYRPVGDSSLLGVSCHCANDLGKASQLRADFVVLGPVLETASHRDSAPIGWEMFAGLVSQAGLPVYALGGLGEQDVAHARRVGAQGIAGISRLWEDR